MMLPPTVQLQICKGSQCPPRPMNLRVTDFCDFTYEERRHVFGPSGNGDHVPLTGVLPQSRLVRGGWGGLQPSGTGA